MTGAHPSIYSSAVFHRSLREDYDEVISGSGLEFKLKDGRSVIDAAGGPAVAVLGHQQPSVLDAIMRQMAKISYVYSASPYKNEAVEKLASLLTSYTPGVLSKALFVGSGSEATDTALKLVSQYWVEIGQPERVNIISRHQSYHGNTLGALSISGNESRRAYYKHWMSHKHIHFVDPCYAFRAKLQDETDDAYVQRLEKQLEDKILELGPKTVSAFVAETISGSSLGCVPAVPGYFQMVRNICDKYGILLVLDEIMCGMGKTGTMHAWEQEGIRGPDIQMIGKALGAGFVALSATLCNDAVFDAVAQGSGTLVHGHTFQAHPVSCAAAVEVQRIIERQGLVAKVQQDGKIFEDELHRQLSDAPFVANIRGRGFFQSVEFLLEPETKVPFEPQDKFSDLVVSAARKHGLFIMGNFGVTGKIFVDHILLSPAYVAEQEELKEIVRRLKAAVYDAADAFRRCKGLMSSNGEMKISP